MKIKFSAHAWLVAFTIALLLQACSANTPIPPINTTTVPSTDTPQPTSTRAPNLTATQRAKEWINSMHLPTLISNPTPQERDGPDAEAQKYFELGYLPNANGRLIKFGDFKNEWAQLGWYHRLTFDGYQASDFYMSGHFKWSSAYRSADLSGCGFIFAEQENGDHYAVFLDRSKVLFVETKKYYSPIGTTRGTGRVNFDNPFDRPVEADFTLIVNGAYAYVLVDGSVIGEYTLSQSKALPGKIGLALLSGTNKDFGTRCEITNLHLWIPKNSQ
ncbi:MAG TPA: hypothetical protein VK206_17435 [Anaerolineales bacterium]|nr:hypothetical protein [Anaerolineales bacterium]HLO27641.1 hypothetical protein [Anaerolineales bacterium]